MRTREIGWRRAAVLAGLVLSSAGRVVIWAQEQRAGAGKVPFTLSPELTRVVSPVDGEGAPDYIGAINERYGKGVKPEENVFVGWAEMVGGGGPFMPEEVRAAMLKMAGAKETDPAAVVWQEYTTYLQQVKNMADAEVRAKFQDANVLRKQLWKAEEHAAFADYLKAMDVPLGQMVSIAGRPHWYPPLVSSDGRTMLHANPPSVGLMGRGAMALLSRATLSAQRGDIDGFMRDVTAALRMGRLLTQGPCLTERNMGLQTELMGMEAIGAAAGAGRLSAAQCAAVREMITRLPERGTVEEPVDVVDRYQQLDFVALFALGKDAMVQSGAPLVIDRDAVDWNVVFKEVNAAVDKRVASVRVPTTELLKSVQNNTVSMVNVNMIGVGGGADARMRKWGSESDAAYSLRIAAWIANMTNETGWERTELSRREVIMAGEMLQALLAAAEFREKTGKWPELLSELVPEYIKGVPKDIFSEFGQYQVSFDAGKAGVRISAQGKPGSEGVSLGIP